jgi:hypothetical protein
LSPQKGEAMTATTTTAATTAGAATADPDRQNGPKRQNGRDRRRWSRYDVAGAVPAVLVADDRRIACRVENISLSGARLRVAEPAPPSSDLRLEYQPLSGPSGRCVWWTEDSIGVSFGLTEDSVALAMSCIRIAALESEAPSKLAD